MSKFKVGDKVILKATQQEGYIYALSPGYCVKTPETIFNKLESELAPMKENKVGFDLHPRRWFDRPRESKVVKYLLLIIALVIFVAGGRTMAVGFASSIPMLLLGCLCCLVAIMSDSGDGPTNAC